MLLALWAVIASALHLVSYSVIYTEGEVLHGGFAILVGATVCTILLGFWSRSAAAWCLLGIGGLLLVWQLHATRKLIMLHEEVVHIVRYAEKVKKARGDYPADLSGYTFQQPWVQSHVLWSRQDSTGYRLNYFMYSLGTSFWYDPIGGFGYYPD